MKALSYKNGFIVIGNIDWKVALPFLFVLFPVISMFFPPETYFSKFASAGAHVAPVKAENPFVSKISFMLMLAYLGWIYYRHMRSSLPYLIYGASLFAFAVYVVLTCFWAPNFVDGFNKAYRSLAILALCASLYFVKTEYKAETIISVALNVSVIASILTVILLPRYGLESLNGYVGAWKGAFLHKNITGQVVSLAFLFNLYKLSVADSKRKQQIYIALTLVSLALLLLSRSGTAIMSGLFAAGVFGFFSYFNTRLRAHLRLAVYAVLANVIFLIGLFGSNIQDIVFTLTGKSTDFTGRAQIWTAVKEAIADKPLFGHGSGFWVTATQERAYLWSRIGDAPPQSHNAYLEIIMQYGFTGLGLYLIVCGVTLVMVGRGILNNAGKLPILYFAIFMLWLVRSISEASLGFDDSAIFWHAIPVFGMVYLNHRRTSNGTGKGSGPENKTGKASEAPRRRRRRFSTIYAHL